MLRAIAAAVQATKVPISSTVLSLREAKKEGQPELGALSEYSAT
jgi:hypothetical protein